MKIASNAAIFSCCTGKFPAKWVQLNIYCSSMLKSSFVGTVVQFDIEAFCFGCHLFFTFYSLASRTNDFLSFHILHSMEGGAVKKEQQQEPRIQCVLDWPAGPGGFAFVSIPFHSSHAVHSLPSWEKSVNRQAATMTRSRTMANDLAKSPSVFQSL